MADEQNQEQTGGGVQDLGATTRITPDTSSEQHNPTLEEQAADQAKAKEGAGTEGDQSQDGDRSQETGAEKDKPEGGDKDGKPTPVDFKGSVFEGMSEEMQGKVAPFAAAYAENGALTDAEISEAAKATGFSEAAIKQFIAGAEATASAAPKPIYEAFGGEDQFKEFQGWTAEEGNLTAREEATINKALAAGDFDTAAQLMEAPKERWKAGGGGAAARDVTRTEGGDKGAGATGATFANWDQVQKAMNDPRYKSDQAYRTEVEQKIGRSKL